MIKRESIERSVLASILQHYDSESRTGLALEAIGGLTESHFTNSQYRELFNAIKRMVSSGVLLDVLTVGDFAKLNVTKALTDIIGVSTSPSLSRYIELLDETLKANKIKEFAQNYQAQLASTKTVDDVKRLIQDAERAMMDTIANNSRTQSDEGYLKDYMQEYFSRKKDQMDNKKFDGVPTGIPSLDTQIGGLANGDTVVVAGRTGMGKSSFISTMISHQIMDGYRPALFSLELGRVEIVDKTISIISDIDSDFQHIPYRSINNPAGNFQNAGMTGGNLESMRKVSEKYLLDSMMYLRGSSRITVEEVMAKCRKLKSEGNLDIIYIDHIGLLVHDKNNERSELTHITNSLRLFAGEMKVPIVEVVQLNRGADTTTEKPRKSHLKGSGSIEEDASLILMPWRPSAINSELPPEESEIIVAKGRNSGEGSLPTHFCTATTRFTAQAIDLEATEAPTGKF